MPWVGTKKALFWQLKVITGLEEEKKKRKQKIKISTFFDRKAVARNLSIELWSEKKAIKRLFRRPKVWASFISEREEHVKWKKWPVCSWRTEKGKIIPFWLSAFLELSVRVKKAEFQLQTCLHITVLSTTEGRAG